LIVDGRPMFHRSAELPDADARAIVHVHGFGISGTYMQPTAALLASRFRTFVPDLPGHGRSMRLEGKLDLPRLAKALDAYCDAVGVETATFVGNSLGCPVICALAAEYPDRIERAILVSPAGGPNNRPLPKALGQMALDGPREPLSMVPIAVRDYLHFGAITSLTLFRAMTRFPTVDRLHQLHVPTLAIVGERDPLVNLERVVVLSGMDHVSAVVVPGAHALNYSKPEIVAALIAAHIDGAPLHTDTGVLADVRPIHIPE
jgi:pimeloyl-ACP methyl ester carboxylesterase